MRTALGLLRDLARAVAFRWRVSVIRLSETFSARQVTVSELWIRVAPVDDGYMLEADYVLQGAAASGRILVFSYGDPSLRYADLNCQGADVVHRRYVFAIRRREGTGWNAVRLRIRLLWRDEVGDDLWRRSRFILIPEFLPLPRFRRPPAGGLPPRPTVIFGPGCSTEGLEVHGVRQLADSTEPAGPDKFIEIAIERSGLGDPGSGVSISTELTRRFTTAQRVALNDRASVILQHFGESFATGIPGRVLLVHPTDGPEAAGTVVLGTASRNPSLPARVPDWFVLATRLASIWVGTGCRLVGRNSGDWELAVRGALALRLVQEMVAEEFSSYLTRLQHGVYEWTLSDIPRWFANGLWYPRSYAIALSAFSAINDQSERLARLAALVRTHWGGDLPVKAVKHALDLGTIP